MTAAETPRRKLALGSFWAIAMFVVIVVLGAWADLASKAWAFESLLSDPDVPARAAAIDSPNLPADLLLHRLNLHRPLADGIDVTLSTNAGVIFGIPMPRGASVGVTALTMLLVVGFFAMSDARHHLLHAALALILAGAIGNLYDRAWGQVDIPGTARCVQYQVRDFIDCSRLTTFGDKSYYPWVFNIADVLLVVGVAIPLIQWAFAPLAKRRRKTTGE